MIISMNSHHPSIHDVHQLIVILDGKDVIDCELVLGYLHIGMEKLAKKKNQLFNIFCMLLVEPWSAVLHTAQTKKITKKK